MYYNSAVGQFRCFQNNSWQNCISGLTDQDAWWVRPDGTSAFATVGTATVTSSGTLVANNASDTALMQATTVPISGSVGGFVSTNFATTQRGYNTSFSAVVRTSATLPTSGRVFVGLISAAPANANDSGGNHIGFRYSTVTGDTGVSTGWRATTRNGTTNTIAAANVGGGAAVAVDTTYVLKWRVDSTNNTVYMSVNGGTEDAVTATLPAATTNLGFASYINATGTNKSINFGRFYCEQN